MTDPICSASQMYGGDFANFLALSEYMNFKVELGDKEEFGHRKMFKNANSLFMK